MGFVVVRGLRGRLFVPEGCSERLKKHPCRDCFSCQQCGDDRCRLCRDRCCERSTVAPAATAADDREAPSLPDS